jgi:outer membrane protein OmpA-like peptidoglycan-associated protein
MEKKIMKKKVSLFVFSLCIVAFMHAQESGKPGYKTPFEAGGAGDNWFIQLGAGAQTILGDKNWDGVSLPKMLSLAPTVSFGKWLNPFLGIRLRGDYGPIHPMLNRGEIMVHDKYLGLGANILWNIPAYFRPYNPERFFGFIPYVGVGGAYRFKNDPYGKDATLTYNGGILMTFRLSNHIDLHLDFGGILTEDAFNHLDGYNVDFIPSATGGITFKLGKQGFKPAIAEPDYALIEDLNNRLNALRAENDRLSKLKPVPRPEPEVVPVPKSQPADPTVITTPLPITFRIGCVVIDDNQQLNIFNAAELIKNTNRKLNIVGYADKDTGSAQYNLKISEKRAKAVANELTRLYNIPAEKLIVDWKGSESQPYGENTWNRVVVITLQ